MDEHTQIN